MSTAAVQTIFKTKLFTDAIKSTYHTAGFIDNEITKSAEQVLEEFLNSEPIHIVSIVAKGDKYLLVYKQVP